MFPEVSEIIPHRHPMIMIDAVVTTDKQSITCSKIFDSDEYGVYNQKVEETVLVECMAQSLAAFNGMDVLDRGCPPARGMLVGVDNFILHSAVLAGRRLDFHVRVTRQFGPFTFTEGTVRQDGCVIAEGNLKFYVEEHEGESEKA